jgi:hypothetical protein
MKFAKIRRKRKPKKRKVAIKYDLLSAQTAAVSLPAAEETVDLQPQNCFSSLKLIS